MSVEEQIAELRQQAGARNDAELASMLFIHRSAIAQWKKRGTVPDKARRAVEKLRLNHAAERSAASELDRLPVGVRQLARALAILYLKPSRADLDDSREVKALARELKVAALHFQEAERAAALILLRDLKRGVDLDVSYERLIRAPGFDSMMIEVIMAPNAWQQTHIGDEALPQ